MKKQVAGMVLMLFLLPLAAGAQQGSIELRSTAETEVVTVNAKGEKEVKRVDAARAKVVPGDTVIFTTHYKNAGKEPAGNVVITNPIPEHTVYVDRSAEGAGTRIDFSVNNGRSYASPGNLTVAGPDGKTRPAKPSDYTHVRWTLNKPLQPGGKGSVSFRGQVK